MTLQEFYKLTQKSNLTKDSWKKLELLGDGLVCAACSIISAERSWDIVTRSKFRDTSKSNKIMSAFIKSHGFETARLPYDSSTGSLTRRRANFYEAYIGTLAVHYGFQYAILTAKELGYFAEKRMS